MDDQKSSERDEKGQEVEQKDPANANRPNKDTS
jgi:hypothetical protein